MSLGRRAAVLIGAIAIAVGGAEAYGLFHGNRVKSHASITRLGGNAPVEAEGTLDNGDRFYFRARGESWSFEAGDGPARSYVWSEPWGDRKYAASYMPEETARLIIESCAEMVVTGVPPPQEFADLPVELVAARRLARGFLDDLALYAPDGGMPAPEEIAQARKTFLERHPLHEDDWEEDLATLPRRIRGEVVPLRSLTNAPSATSVGRRWRAMLARMPEANREPLRAIGIRWIGAWAATPEIARVFNEQISN